MLLREINVPWFADSIFLVVKAGLEMGADAGISQ
jgi:hypothetical protein